MGLLDHLKCKFKFDSKPLTRKKKSKHRQKRASSRVQSPSLANQGSPIAQNTSRRAKHTNQAKAQQDAPTCTSPQKEEQRSKNEDTISNKHDGDVAHGPLTETPPLSPRVDILNDMKATLLAHGMSLQDKNTRMIGTSLVRIEPLHYPEQPEVFARRANLGVSHCLSISWINECMRSDTFSHQSELCPFCDDEFPANPSIKLISLRAMFKRHPKAVQRMEQSNPDALYLPVSFFWMFFRFSTDCWPDPAVLISYTVFHNCRVLSVASC
jgi:hypothetical protein